MTKPVIRILVLCTGNSCRSQIAEGFFRHYGRKRLEVRSAGLNPGVVNPMAVQVMRELGIDITEQTSKHLREFANQNFDFIITVCDNAARNCPVFPGQGVRLHWPFDDPAEAAGTEAEILKVFRRVRDEIGIKVRDWLTSNQLMHFDVSTRP